MTIKVTPAILMKAVFLRGRITRLLIVTLMIGSLETCAVAPTEPSVPKPVQTVAPDRGVVVAINMYNSGNYASAIRGFDEVITSEASSAGDRRLAHLGKAVVYLGNDPDLHSVENAKMSLISAGEIVPGEDEEFTAETGLLMDSVSVVIGTESKYTALQAKSGESGTEVEQLKRERDALQNERDGLLAEQITLNEALEKLKELTLGD